MQQIIAVLAGMMILGAIEFPFREYVFTPSVARAWYWFQWHESALPPRVVVFLDSFAVLLADAETGRILLRVTREFTRAGELAHTLEHFYRSHGRSPGG